ncbi:hypothetical protein GCM10011533_27940 [Streptosporangium jomthongense]|nr:hypothetical protein GCM10011533_27940 [Streptosporangium jomthongense]
MPSPWDAPDTPGQRWRQASFKARWLTSGEYSFEERAYEKLENQLVGQIPISTFFDAKAGVRFDTPEGPDRTYAVLGVGKGLVSTETGLRLSYDLIDRAFSPYLGIVHERQYGDTADFARADGGSTEDWFAVVGARLSF